ncbi:hypothetical protein [Paenibacillus sp. L3-i20]|uniref:hypothetical protein n=1 Tax=Paenibacillus sp. L3-i20 TaxID=2905833 RepID=UPI001EDE625A|nr:hypothetical protein [Paenibacillus sp. L3-i20]
MEITKVVDTSQMRLEIKFRTESCGMVRRSRSQYLKLAWERIEGTVNTSCADDVALYFVTVNLCNRVISGLFFANEFLGFEK